MSVSKVSVCMIAYNHGKYIEQAIQSVLMQKTDFHVELVIGEDCSKDNTRQIVIDYQKKYPDKIKLLLHEKNAGLMPNFIQTLQLCDGDYIALLEGDDYWTDPYKLQKQINFLQQHQDFSASFHDVKVKLENKSDAYFQFKRLDRDVFALRDVISSWFIPTCSIVFRNNFKIDLPDWYKEILSGDRFLIILIATKGKIKYLNEVMAIYRKHSEGISVYGDDIKIFKNNIELFKNLNKYFHYQYNNLFKKAIFIWHGNLALQYRLKKKNKDSVQNLMVCTSYIQNFSDLKIFIKDYLYPAFTNNIDPGFGNIKKKWMTVLPEEKS